jgi:hypothetical protein
MFSVLKLYFERHSYIPNLPATYRFRTIAFHYGEEFVIKLTRTKSNSKIYEAPD